MITWIRLRDPRIPAGRFPVKSPAVDEDAADGRPMPADKFRRRMHHDICAVFNGADQIRCGKCGVHDQRDVMAVRDLGQFFQIGQIGVGIAQCLHEDRLRIFLYRRFKRALHIRIHKRGRHMIVQQKCVRQIIVRPAVDRLGRHDVFPCLGQRLECIGQGRRPGRHSQRGHATLQRRDPPLKNIHRWIGQPPIDVPRIPEAEAVRRVL